MLKRDLTGGFNMSSDNVFESVKSILVDQLNISEDSVQMDSLFVDDLNADSLDMVELVMAMEQEFNIRQSASRLLAML